MGQEAEAGGFLRLNSGFESGLNYVIVCFKSKRTEPINKYQYLKDRKENGGRRIN